MQVFSELVWCIQTSTGPKDTRARPTACSTIPAIAAREEERIYRGPVWHYVALEAELPAPGDYKSTFVGATPVVVTRGADGALHSFVNRCAHRGSLLCRDAFGSSPDGFTCVYHAWSYDLAGNLASVAFRRGVRGEGGLPADFDFAAHGLERLRVATFAGLVFATFDPATPPLDDFLDAPIQGAIRRTMRAPLRLLGYDSQIIHANWKTYAENSRDSYHANILHTFFATFGISRHSQEAGMIQDARGLHYYTFTKAGTETESADYAQAAAALRSEKGEKFRLADPSLVAWSDEFGDGASTFMISVFPVLIVQQVSHSLAVRQLLPKGPEKCELVYTFFGFDDDSPELARQRLVQANLIGSAGLVSMEDSTISELVAQGTAGDPDATSCMEMGGRDLVSGGATKLTERPLRSFWHNYRTLMGL